MQKTRFKYGLKNASSYLKYLKEEKKLQASNEIQTVHENTFIDEDLLLNPNIELQQDPQNISYQYQQSKQSLADLVIKEHLANTLRIYEEDLAKLQENRDNLIDAIQQLSQKVQGFSDVHTKNQNLQLQNFRHKKQIEISMKAYHKLRLQLWGKKIKQCHRFDKKKQKLRRLIELMELQLEERVYVQSWQEYNHQLEMNKHYAAQNKGRMQIGLEEKVELLLLGQPKNEEEEKACFGRPAKQRDGLLGDLKNFAKNFKMP